MYLYTYRNDVEQKMKFSSIYNFFLIVIIRDSAMGFCGRHDMSCTHQLWSKSIQIPPAEACFVKYFKVNSSECHLLEFEKSEENGINFGNVILKSPKSDESKWYKQTLFEIHFSNITWHYAKIKIGKIGMERQKNMCRTYKIWENVTIPFDSKLTNNCTFSRSDYEGEDYVFEYELGKPFVYRKFLFKVPFFSNFSAETPLNLHQIFSYVDVTNPEVLTLHIQPIDSEYNVSEYLVELFMEDYNNVSTLITRIILHSHQREMEQLQFTHPVGEKTVKYYFLVAAISSKCDDQICLKTPTPKIFVRNHKNTWALASCIGVLSIVIILGVFIPGFVYLKKRKKNKKNIDYVEIELREEDEQEIEDELEETQFSNILENIDLSGTPDRGNECHTPQPHENYKNYKIQELPL